MQVYYKIVYLLIQNRYHSVVDVVRNYIASRDYALEPFPGSLEVKNTGKTFVINSGVSI